MKLRSVVVVLTAAAIGAGAPGFAQAAHVDGYSRADSQYSGGHGGYPSGNWDRGDHRDHRGGSNGLAIALGIGMLGVVLASELNDRAQPQQYGYAPTNQYGYAPANQYGYAPAYQPAPQYGYTPAYPQPNYGPGYGYRQGRSPYGY